MFSVEDIQHGKLKFAGRSKAKVLDNKDPQQKGRIRVVSPLLGQSPWIPYLQTSFSFDIPEPGDIVFIECDGGFETHPIAWGKLLSPDAEKVPLPSAFKKLVPTNRGSYTPGGHLIEYDDGDPVLGIEKGIRFTTSDGSKIHISEDISENKIVLEKSAGQKLEIDSGLDTVTVNTVQGQKIQLQATVGVTITSATGDTVFLGSNKASLSNAAGSTVEINNDNSIKVEDSLGNKIETSPFGISIADNQGNSVLTSPDGIEAENSLGGKLKVTASESSILDSTGAGMKASAGQVALGNSAVELLTLLEEAFTALSTQTAAGFGAPTSTAGDFVQLLTKIKTLKGSL